VKGRAASRLVWGLTASALVLGTTQLILLGLRGVESGRLFDAIGFTTAFLTMAVVGAFIASRQPGNAVGWIFIAVPFIAAMSVAAWEYAIFALVGRPDPLPGALAAVWISEWPWALVLSLPFTYLLMLFPDGRLPSPRWRPFAWATGVFIGFVTVAFAFDPIYHRRLGVGNPLGIEAFEPLVDFVEGPGFAGLFVAMFVSLASLVIRYRRSDRGRRQQIKWVAYAAAIASSAFALSSLSDVLGLESAWSRSILPLIAFVTIPVAVGVAILRFRLFDIDVVIRRTLVVGILAAFVTALYVGIVVGIGALVGSRGNLLLSIVATALIALAFQPAREWARRFTNRLVYGKRATPYEVMSEFAERAAGTYSFDEVLPRMAEIVAAGTGARRAAVWLRVGGELRRAAVFPAADDSWPASVKGDDGGVPGADASVPVRHRGEVLGAITVAMPLAEPLTPTHDKLLADVASQAGLVLRNVRLIEDLRASRQRLVAAQDEERRRLERNIHDGAQQQLVALAVKLRLVETLAPKDPEKAARMAAEAKAEVQDALENLRDLARGIYPPLLADQGLAAALEAQARKAAIPVSVHPDGVGRYPQEVEAGAYFCVLEALQNVAKYAEASRVDVNLRADNGELVFEVADDGKGFDPERTPPGSGLTNMRDRLEALGGSVEVTSRPGEGTTVSGRIPVRQGERT
jgi:signal transduction histidine kinase